MQVSFICLWILSREDENFEVLFLKQSEEGIYSWPGVDDIVWVGAADIIGPWTSTEL